MAAGSSKSNPPKPRKRVEAEDSSNTTTLVRARDGSAFVKCEECNKNVPAVLISMHDCSLEAKIKMNLEAQVIEKPAEVKRKPAERKKPISTEPKPKRLRKNVTDTSKPKRPPTAFFLFMDDFRKEYKAANPDSKLVKEVAKEGGAKWKSMTDEEKKPYSEKAAELKAEYEKMLEGNKAEDEKEEEAGSEKEAQEDEDVVEKEEQEDEDVAKKEVQDEEVAEKDVQEENLDDY